MIDRPHYLLLHVLAVVESVVNNCFFVLTYICICVEILVSLDSWQYA